MSQTIDLSLFGQISKVLERCVLVKTRDHLHQYVSDNQHAFIPVRSCTTQLVQVLECIGQQLDNGKQTDRHNLLGHEQSI